MSGLFVGHEIHRGYDGTRRGERVELDIGALTTHAFVCGAIGMGKTVFSKAIVEEVAMAGVPVIAIDVKGDLASLAVNADVVRSGRLNTIFGDRSAALRTQFEDGLATSPSLRARHEEFARKVDVRLFTPRYDGARRLSMTGLPTFTGPSADPLERQDRRTLVEALARGLCSRRPGRRAEGRGEREAKFVEELIWNMVERGIPLSGTAGIERLVRAVGEPPFAELGGMPLDDFVRPAWRQDLQAGLAARITGNERAWYEGERLDLDTLIGGGDGRTPLAVLYLGHIDSFEEQASVIAQTCSEIYRWMRRAGGSSTLRALLYIDEVGGGEGRNAFYPSAPFDPPSKAPLALLVKQGRSNGVGVLLATQNPMSVDVRGLGNMGTWAVGRLLQNNDFARIQHLFDASQARRQRMREDIVRAGAGEFLLQVPGAPEPIWVRERWLYTLHQTLSPEQVHALHKLRAELPRRPIADEPEPGLELRSPPVEERDVEGEASGDAATRMVPQTVDVETATVPVERCWRLQRGDRRAILETGRVFVLGRGEGVDFRVTGDTVSRKHLSAAAGDGDRVRLSNLSTKNPARVNGRKLTTEVELGQQDSPVELRLGDEVVSLEWV